MTVLHKKQIVLGALILMVGVAGYLNWQYEGEKEGSTVSVNVSENVEDETLGEAEMVNNSSNYFTEAKMNRETARSKASEILKSTIVDANASQEAKDTAQNKIIEISKNIESEVNIENLIKAKGFEDAVAFISDDNITITVKSRGLTAPETSKIKDIVIEETGNNNIKIVEVK